jgi:hypothetical protein
VFQQAMSDLSTQEGLAVREAYDWEHSLFFRRCLP